jgi:hypothetical protein
MNTRADPLASLAQFEPKPATERKPKPEPDAIEKLANQHGFTSRPTAPTAPVERSKRRFKTGRNVQINVKGTAEAKARFYRLADEMDVPLGEFLEIAMDALEEKRRSGK